MKKTNYKIFALSLFLTAGMVGCKKQLDINKNPNQPTEDVINADQVLPNAALGTATVTSNAYGWLSNWMGYWSASGSFNPSTEESSYNITNTFQETKWQGVYNVLFDLNKVDEKATADGQDFYKAISKVLAAHLYQNMVDLYGNIPFSQSFKPTEFRTPQYDDAKTIYDGLQALLDEAIGLLKTAPVTNAAKAADVVFEGDSGKWIRFANTIKLRLLIRTTQVNANPAAELAKIKANGGVLQSGESADVEVEYQNSAGKQSPFFASFGLLPSGQEANTFFRANQFAIDNFKARDDDRMRYFFAPASSPANPNNPYVGTVYGADPDVNFSGDRTSNIGPGLATSFDQPAWILTSVESMFLQAEAWLRGWDIGGPYTEVTEAYEEAVRESYRWLGVTDPVAAADDYMNRVADIADSTIFQSKLNLVIREKYIALTGINPLEAWGDYRRLNIPANIPLSVLPARGTRKIPVRLVYPSSEYAVNAANVQAQGSINTQTSTLFWDK